MRKRILASALLVLTVSSCAVQEQQQEQLGTAGGVKVMNWAAMIAEYHKLAGTYPWPLPQGIHFPTTLATSAEPTMYEVGEGANQADSFWICSWMGEWLKTRKSDPRAAAVAWQSVERADQTQLHQEHYDDPRNVWHLEILKPAHAGNTAMFREFYKTSCGYPGLAPAPTT